jgi:hypothetical protein
MKESCYLTALLVVEEYRKIKSYFKPSFSDWCKEKIKEIESGVIDDTSN